MQVLHWAIKVKREMSLGGRLVILNNTSANEL